MAQSAEAEVPHLHTKAAGVKDIFCLQVAVDDVVFMLWSQGETLCRSHFDDIVGGANFIIDCLNTTREARSKMQTTKEEKFENPCFN